MELKNILSNALNIVINKTLQIFGILIIISSLFFLSSLISYSPDDPNFIFTENKEISNFLGLRGSIISDFFFKALA